MASVYRRTWSGKDGVIRQRWVAAYKGRGMDPDAIDRVVRKYAAALGLDRG